MSVRTFQISELREKAYKLYKEAFPFRNKYVDLSIIEPERYTKESSFKGDLPRDILSIVKESRDVSGYAIFVDNQLYEFQIYDENLKVLEIERASSDELFQKHFASVVSIDEDKFTSWHYANLDTGLFIYVPRKVEVEKPFYTLFIHSTDGIAMHPHVLILLDELSKLNYVQEEHSVSDGIEGFYNPVVEVKTLQASKLTLSSIYNLSENVVSYGRRRVIVGRDANVSVNHAWLGGSFTFNSLDLVMNGPGAEGEDTQIFFGRKKQFFALMSKLLHKVGDSVGNVLVRGALKDTSKSFFDGLIRIYPKAQRSNAFLEEHTLLLNPGARSDAIPGLEIEANDVRCTHSATVGEIEEEKLFYLESRGIDELHAKKLLVMGFFEFAIEKVRMDSVRKRLIELIDAKWN